MEVTYTWEIGPMDVSNELMGDDVNDLEDAIRAIHWKFTGATEDTEAWIYGSAALEPVDVENWIAFEDVTEDESSSSDESNRIRQHI